MRERAQHDPAHPPEGAASPSAAPWGEVRAARPGSVPPGVPAAPLHRTPPIATPLERAREAAITRVQERFPGVHAWWGRSTNRWWAYVPTNQCGRLLESDSLDDLMVAISKCAPFITYEQGQSWTNR
ncbi:hypothetical protein GCM10009678_31360 [Actinomadura kijaniata]